jgi:hypothetical protein
MTQPVHAIAFPLAIDGGLAELRRETDMGDHVDQMLRMLLLTDPGERPYRPTYGCGIRRMVFSPLNESAASLAKVSILSAIEDHLSTVLTPEAVEVEFRNETAEIAIAYRLRTTGERRLLRTELRL